MATEAVSKRVIDPVRRRNQILKQVAGVPALSASTTQVITLVQDVSVDIDEVKKAIEYDASLTADILKMANSSAHGGKATISSIDQAIMRFGLEWVYRFVLATAVGPIANQPVRGYDLPPESLWWHSVAVAVGTEELVNALDQKKSPLAFTAGLLHDLGKTIMGTFLKIDARAITQVVEDENVSFDAAERAVLGIDHAEVGAVLLDQWNLPEPILDAVRYHHHPEGSCKEEARTIVSLVHIADALCLEMGIGLGSDGLTYRCSGEARRQLGVTAELGEQVIANIQIKVEELKSFFLGEKE